MSGQDQPRRDELDPQEFVRAILGISHEDAEKVRDRTPATRKRPAKQDGPSADYGDESTNN